MPFGLPKLLFLFVYIYIYIYICTPLCGELVCVCVCGCVFARAHVCVCVFVCTATRPSVLLSVRPAIDLFVWPLICLDLCFLVAFTHNIHIITVPTDAFVNGTPPKFYAKMLRHH